MSERLKGILSNPPVWLGCLMCLGLLAIFPLAASLEAWTGLDLGMQVVIGIVVAIGGMGIYYWRRGDYRLARQGIGIFVFFVGLLAGSLAGYEYGQRNKTAQSMAEVSTQLLTATDGSTHKAGLKDSYEAEKAKYDKQTVLLYLSGAFASCCLLFVVNLLANIVARGPDK